MRPPFAVAVAAVALIAGCTANDDDTEVQPATAAQFTAAPATRAPATSALATSVPAIGETQFAVEPLGLSFRLPESFVVADDANLVFFARSLSPRSLFSIAEDSPDVSDHVAEPGESLSEVDLGSVTAVVVADAVLEGMPEGISSNELLVSNGDQSFSAIMSAPPSDLSELWDVFVDSVTVAPAE